MKKMILCLLVMLGVFTNMQAKDLVVYFSGQGHTQAVAEEIAKQMGADILRLEAAEPYAANPYNDSQRIQNEAYQDLRPSVANLPTAEYMAQYDRNKLTPHSKHVPETLPEDLNPDDITTPGPADDAGIDMPGSARGVANWLKSLGLTATETAIHQVKNNDAAPFELHRLGNNLLQVRLASDMANNQVEILRADGTLLHHLENATKYDVQLPLRSVYLISVINQQNGKRYSQKVAM